MTKCGFRAGALLCNLESGHAGPHWAGAVAPAPPSPREPHCGACNVLIPVGAIAFRVGIDRVVIDPRRHHGYRIANVLEAGDWNEPKVSWVCEQCYAGSMAAEE